ncbi:MAG: hypothetical protein JW860_06780 [Sedimentisphaerales bacterium]|nr:hypothetical protein [Sedimentisphaerales bacterium]
MIYKKNTNLSQWLFLIILAVLLGISLPQIAPAAPNSGYLPTKAGDCHLNLNPEVDNEYDLIPIVGGEPDMPNPLIGDPCGVYRTGEWVHFIDEYDQDSPQSPWHWETELYNPNDQPMAFIAGYYWPTGLGIFLVTMDPGASFSVDIIFSEVPEESTEWVFSCTSYLPDEIGVDTAVTEPYSSKSLLGLEDPNITIQTYGVVTYEVMPPGTEPDFKLSCIVQPECPGYPAGDINKDCMVDLMDFMILAATWLDSSL